MLCACPSCAAGLTIYLAAEGPCTTLRAEGTCWCIIRRSVWLSLLFSSPPVAQAGREGERVVRGVCASVVCGLCASIATVRGNEHGGICAWSSMPTCKMPELIGVGGAGEQVAAYHHRSGLHAHYQVFFFFATCWS